MDTTPGLAFYKKKKFRIVVIIIVMLIAIRLALPYVILHFANERLAKMPGYFGHINDIDLAIYRGAYKIKDVYLNKVDSVDKKETEFFDAMVIDLSLHWGALFEGEIVGKLKFESPTLRFTKEKAEFNQVKKDSNDFRKLLDDFMPLRVNRLEITHGTIRYKDPFSNPKVDIGIENAYVKAENLTNVKEEKLLPSTLEATATVYEGDLRLSMKMDPLAIRPTFDMNAELKNTDLTKLNDFFKAYAKVDVNKGIFGLYTEGAANEGRFVGYVKPFLKNLDVLGPEDKDDNVLRKFWEGVVGTGGVIFKNQARDQVASKIPLEGTLNEQDPDIWSAIISVLRNAFVEALEPSIDNQISINSVGELKVEDEKAGEKKEDDKKGGFLKKIFKGKNKEKSGDEKK